MYRTAIIAASTTLCLPAIAHEGDVAIANFGGLLVTGVGSDEQGAPPPEFPERVFAAELAEQAGFVFTDEPGFLGPFGDGFGAGTALSFNLRAALREWNGSDFLTVSDLAMRVSKGNLEVITPASDQIVPGFTLIDDMSTDFDDHPFYELLDPREGIYLLELELLADGFPTSDPIWISFNFGLDEDEHDASIEWVVENLVPAPASAMVLAPLALGARRRR